VCEHRDLTHRNSNDEPNGNAGPDGDGGLFVMGIGEDGRVLQGSMSYRVLCKSQHAHTVYIVIISIELVRTGRGDARREKEKGRTSNERKLSSSKNCVYIEGRKIKRLLHLIFIEFEFLVVFGHGV
jgi:hypothetical protein